MALYDYWNVAGRSEHLPSSMRGVFWFNDNQAPELLICFEGCECDAEKREVYLPCYGPRVSITRWAVNRHSRTRWSGSGPRRGGRWRRPSPSTWKARDHSKNSTFLAFCPPSENGDSHAPEPSIRPGRECPPPPLALAAQDSVPRLRRHIAGILRKEGVRRLFLCLLEGIFSRRPWPSEVSY